MGDGLPHVELDLVLQVHVFEQVIDDVRLYLVRIVRSSLRLLFTNLFYSLHCNYYKPHPPSPTLTTLLHATPPK